jgi:hypothetical protein
MAPPRVRLRQLAAVCVTSACNNFACDGPAARRYNRSNGLRVVRQPIARRSAASADLGSSPLQRIHRGPLRTPSRDRRSWRAANAESLVDPALYRVLGRRERPLPTGDTGTRQLAVLRTPSWWCEAGICVVTVAKSAGTSEPRGIRCSSPPSAISSLPLNAGVEELCPHFDEGVGITPLGVKKLASRIIGRAATHSSCQRFIAGVHNVRDGEPRIFEEPEQARQPQYGQQLTPRQRSFRRIRESAFHDTISTLAVRAPRSEKMAPQFRLCAHQHSWNSGPPAS